VARGLPPAVEGRCRPISANLSKIPSGLPTMRELLHFPTIVNVGGQNLESDDSVEP
jgi:hypothetical protein